ncbi:LysR family transcriptional regulator [Paraburkholderia ferrariae]|uniref:LysR family transcriptional regulator n=1 Tax=Paraburkholderia ferrariae TaxID=386056 RepID=UPI000A5E655F|nr:LysR family transcriptional regulator [Paraburkholderia ferrariae]
MFIGEINQRRLRYFHEVLSRGSIRGAADALNTASSVLTRQLKLLEEEIGTPLFERGNRGVTPTEAAHALLAYWRGCQSERAVLENTLQNLNGLQIGSARLAISEGFVDPLMDHVLTPFINRYPRLNVTVTTMPVNDVVSNVANDDADIGLAYNPPPAVRVIQRASVANPVRLLTSHSHPLATAAKPLALADIAPFPVALMSPAFGLGQIVQVAADLEHIRLNPALVSNSLATLKRFVRSGDGVTFLSHSTTTGATEDPAFISLKLAHPVFETTKACLLLRENRHLSKVAQTLVDLIVNRMSIFGSEVED